MAEKRRGKRTCRWESPTGVQCREKWLQDSPWQFCKRHETIKLVEMRAKMRDEEAERQRIPLAQAIFVATMAQHDLGVAQELAEDAFRAAEVFLAVVKDRSVG